MKKPIALAQIKDIDVGNSFFSAVSRRFKNQSVLFFGA
jgi:hypothetical protein